MATNVIQGIPAGSINEWNVAMALNRLHWDFDYQVPVFGGRMTPGGQVIDFLIKLPPKPIPLFVQGAYWHNAAKAITDLIKQSQVARIRAWADPVLIEEQDCETVDLAYAWLRGHIL
jgi:hypothetical protein